MVTGFLKSKGSAYRTLDTTINPISSVANSTCEDPGCVVFKLPTPLEIEKQAKKKRGLLCFGITKRIFNAIKSWYRANFKLPTACIPIFDKVDKYFGCTSKGSNVELEIFAGIINFFSCSYILAVVPLQMAAAGYSSTVVATTISLWCGLGTILSGFITNTP